MGTCSSTDAVITIATAKVILQDGQLHEYSFPVKISDVLAKYPKTFICNSDELEFDDVVSSLDESDVLQMGQLYFALPVSKLKHRFQAKEIAALAVKAGSALKKSGHQWIPFPPAKVPGYENMSPTVAAGGDVRRVRGRGNNGRRRRELTAVLSGIPE